MRPSVPFDRSLWSIQTWCENICTLIASSGVPVKTRLRMMTLCTALAGGEVTPSSIGSPMFRPPPVSPEFAPTPTIVLSEVTSCIGPGSVMTPLTWTISAPGRAMAARNPAASDTVTAGPPQPPVVPFWPSANTSANPMMRGGVVQSTGGVDGVDDEGGSLGGTTGTVSATTSSNAALA
jgi:hypothetical protein